MRRTCLAALVALAGVTAAGEAVGLPWPPLGRGSIGPNEGSADASAARAAGPDAATGLASTPASTSASASASDGPTFQIGPAQLKIEVCAANIIRVAYSPSATFFFLPTLATAPKRCVAATPWRMTRDAEKGVANIITSQLNVGVDLKTGAVQFRDPANQIILAERPGARSLTPARIPGEPGPVFNVRQQWEPNQGESLHGLGQHQHDLIDIKDHDLALRQYNTEIFIPFLVSSRGYGILWDNTSFTRFGDLSQPLPLPGTVGLYSAPKGPEAAAPPSAAAGDVAIGAKGSADWSGTVTPPVTGDYLFSVYSAGDIKLSVDGKLVVDHWRQGWLPGEDVARVRLTAGRPVPVRLQWTRDIGVNIVRLLWKPPVADRTTSLWSEVGDGVDYTFVYGPDLDRVIAGYRQLTGQAPLPPRWAFGLWQSRERYTTQQQSLDVLAGFRARQIPVDVIVQDWRYWPDGQWGSHAFDPKRFPDPAAWIAEIHQRLHARLMISVWPKFYPGTANFDALNAAGFLYQANLGERKLDFLGHPFTYYDAFNPAARHLYWSQINQALFTKKVDAWWMDASEPEVVEGPFPSVEAQVAVTKTHMTPTALGSGARLLNAYSLLNSQAVYDGQRAAAPSQRPLILTRSGFAGQQRYGAASWSGDISSTWTALRKQIPAGLGFSVSGLPYWTLDAGGFSVPPRFASAARGSPAQDEWRELQTRWFEYATFLPLLRMHGQAPKREMWEFGGDGSPAFEAQKKFDRIRYRLLPYVYSLAGAVTHEAGTMMRPLVMDFRDDARARGVADQYMFGPALLVSPITAYQARTRAVYLPRTAGGWYDFWTGKVMAAGAIQARAPFDEIPLHVRAGSIIPFGPELQYTDEKPADTITIYVYAGADGAFTLYEDQGTTNDYERGGFSRIPLRWSDSTRVLSIGKRLGAFPEMLTRRTFRVVLVSPVRPVPFSFAPPADTTVPYVGQEVILRFM